MLADGDGVADIDPAADGDHGVGVEAAVGPHRELSPGPAVVARGTTAAIRGGLEWPRTCRQRGGERWPSTTRDPGGRGPTALPFFPTTGGTVPSYLPKHFGVGGAADHPEA